MTPVASHSVPRRCQPGTQVAVGSAWRAGQVNPGLWPEVCDGSPQGTGGPGVREGRWGMLPPSAACTPNWISELGVWGSDSIQHSKGCEALAVCQTLQGPNAPRKPVLGVQQHRGGSDTELPGEAQPLGGGGSSRLEPTNHQRLTVSTELQKDLESQDVILKISRIQSNR